MGACIVTDHKQVLAIARYKAKAGLEDHRDFSKYIYHSPEILHN